MSLTADSLDPGKVAALADLEAALFVYLDLTGPDALALVADIAVAYVDARLGPCDCPRPSPEG